MARSVPTGKDDDYQEQMQAALSAATQLMKKLDIEALELRARSQGQEGAVAFDCFGTAGTLGTFCGCGGTFGTFGCAVASEQEES